MGKFLIKSLAICFRRAFSPVNGLIFELEENRDRNLHESFAPCLRTNVKNNLHGIDLIQNGLDHLSNHIFRSDCAYCPHVVFWGLYLNEGIIYKSNKALLTSHKKIQFFRRCKIRQIFLKSFSPESLVKFFSEIESLHNIQNIV